jgi:hypothetical protein
MREMLTGISLQPTESRRRQPPHCTTPPLPTYRSSPSLRSQYPHTLSLPDTPSDPPRPYSPTSRLDSTHFPPHPSSRPDPFLDIRLLLRSSVLSPPTLRTSRAPRRWIGGRRRRRRDESDGTSHASHDRRRTSSPPHFPDLRKTSSDRRAAERSHAFHQAIRGSQFFLKYWDETCMGSRREDQLAGSSEETDAGGVAGVGRVECRYSFWRE